MTIAIKELQEHDFGWRPLLPHEYGYEHPKHACDREHCVKSRRVNGYRQEFMYHPWRNGEVT